MNADDYFTTPPENQQPIMSAEELQKRDEELAEWQASTAEAWIWEKNY